MNCCLDGSLHWGYKDNLDIESHHLSTIVLSLSNSNLMQVWIYKLLISCNAFFNILKIFFSSIFNTLEPSIIMLRQTMSDVVEFSCHRFVANWSTQFETILFDISFILSSDSLHILGIGVSICNIQ